MIYGLYLSAQGANAQATRLDVIANNLANASTNAFKRDLAVFQAHQPFDVEQGAGEEPPGNLNQSTGGTSVAEVVTNFQDGPLTATGGAYDLALSGPGFFRVSDGQQEYLTRNGRLTVNSDNELIMHDTGLSMLGRGGRPIVIPEEATQISVTADGTIHSVTADGLSAPVAQLDLVQPQSFDELAKAGDGLYVAVQPLAQAGSDVTVQQGFLEESGTRPVLEMMEMIQASRGFETNVSMIKTQDEALGQLLQSVQQ